MSAATSSSAPSREHGVEPGVDALSRAPSDRERGRGPSIRSGASAGAARAPRNEASGRSVAAKTSSARKIRCRSLASRRAAVSGSRALSSAWSSTVARPSALRRTSARTASGTGGHVGEAFGQRAQIEARAADEDDRPLADLGQDLARRPRPSSDRKIDRAVDRRRTDDAAQAAPLRGVGRAVRILRSA